MPSQLDLRSFGERLRTVRQQRSKTLKDVYDDTGVSVPTISRIERGDASTAESNTLLKLAQWAKIKVDFFAGQSVEQELGRSTPDVVELHLRADKSLDSKAATLLAKMFRASYEELSKKS